MGTRIYGIGAAENLDNVQELLKISGLDDSHMNVMRDEHDHDDFFHKIGAVTLHKKIFSEKDCTDEKQKRCWAYAKVPFLYAEAELADDLNDNHPNAVAAAALIKFAARPEIASTLSIGWSIDGGVLERTNNEGRADENGKVLARTLGTSLALTVKPCNPKCKIFLENDLVKSDFAAPPPAIYWQALKKSQSTSSFHEIGGDEFKLYLKLSALKKSLSDFAGGFTSMRCKKCGDGVRFFKSEPVNGCAKCKNRFSLSEIWQALNK